MQAEFFRQQARSVWHHAEDADAASQRHRFGNDVISTARHIIAARSRHAAHRHDNGLFLFKQLHGPPHLFGGIGTSAARIDAEHHGLHVFIVAKTVEVVNNFRAENLLSA